MELDKVQKLAKDKSKQIIEKTLKKATNVLKDQIKNLLMKNDDMQQRLYQKEAELHNIKKTLYKQEAKLSEMTTFVTSSYEELMNKDTEIADLVNPKDPTVPSLFEQTGKQVEAEQMLQPKDVADREPILKSPFYLFGSYLDLKMEDKIEAVERELVRYGRGTIEELRFRCGLQESQITLLEGNAAYYENTVQEKMDEIEKLKAIIENLNANQGTDKEDTEKRIADLTTEFLDEKKKVKDE